MQIHNNDDLRDFSVEKRPGSIQEKLLAVLGEVLSVLQLLP